MNGVPEPQGLLTKCSIIYKKFTNEKDNTTTTRKKTVEINRRLALSFIAIALIAILLFILTGNTEVLPQAIGALLMSTVVPLFLILIKNAWNTLQMKEYLS